MAGFQWQAGDWRRQAFDALKANGIAQLVHVPDAGHTPLINAAMADPEIETTVLTTEEEGVAHLAGADLGGQRGVMLMQSSGVGNCINMFSLLEVCGFPFLTLVTMRGEAGEFNPWQVPMGMKTPELFELCGFSVFRASEPGEVGEQVDRAAKLAFGDNARTAVLFSQRLIGTKKF